MYVALAACRGRSANLDIYTVDLPIAGTMSTYRAHGLRSGYDGFKAGDFIGFYTGRWATRRHQRRHLTGLCSCRREATHIQCRS